MRRIKDEVERVRQIQQTITPTDFYAERKYKDDREWSALGYFTDVLKKQGMDYPVFAIKKHPPDPDFMTYTENRKRFKPIEISEIHSPDEKPGDRYKEIDVEGHIIEPVEYPWSSLEKQIADKFKKRYEPDCWLVLYFMMSYAKITMFGSWDTTILAKVKTLKLDESPYQRVFVLYRKGNGLVCIYPERYVILPEQIKGFNS
ncbi:MAG: hypothetical protein HY276_12335 [Ignavibacteriales bacterium]|nr:hypothetical protein [Ignavibacteriales bacterium]MBI3789027.1 hypothetical protein [Ignavibacteriales bacterium]